MIDLRPPDPGRGSASLHPPARDPARVRVGRLEQWLLEGDTPDVQGPHAQEGQHQPHPWWRVMCLTGVDYFSTLGYQPGVAALAAGVLSPIATLLLVLLTLLGALPMYGRVAHESPHGEGSIAMLERLLPWWQGKLFVLCLLGFVGTDFIITITLSAADASAHALENPFVPQVLVGQRVGVTLVLITLLGSIFLKGFTEAIGIAVGLVVPYLLLNAVVVAVSLGHVVQQPAVIVDWQRALLTEHGDPLRMLAVSVLLFPRLALGLSGFETGVAVMPLVRGAPSDTPEQPAGRVRSTRRLLLVAALIMSVFLIFSSFVTITLIPPEAFQPAGKANGRALAYLAHAYLGEWFGTAYDVSTILILSFTGASAMAGLINIVPRYLPRYGMAPEWARAARPLVLVFVTIALIVTLVFQADVDAQGGAYATGVLVLMSSAAIAVALAAWRTRGRHAALASGAIALVFAYTTIANVLERPDGVKIASLFITAIIAASLVSRVWRQTELRVASVAVDAAAQRFIDAASGGDLRIIAHEPQLREAHEYALKERRQRERNRIAAHVRVLFLEVTVGDPSEFAPVLTVRGEEVGVHRVLRAESATVPNAIAAFLLYLRDRTGKVPDAYFSWTEGDPLRQWLRYMLFGHGDIAPLTHEVLRAAEPDSERRPVIHVA
jgi:hypothetical protein